MLPDLVHRVEGFRCFELRGTTLTGRYSTARWVGPVVEARCAPETFHYPQYTQTEEHEAPGELCRCGIHCYYDAQSIVSAVRQGLIGGVVSCWGKLVPHSDGFRAQHAELHAIVDVLDRGRSRRAAEHLGIPVVSTVEELAELSPHGEFPQQLRPA